MSSVVIRPLISEKSLRLAGLGQFTFVVDPRAAAPLIRKAIEDHYQVAITNLQIINRRGTPRTFRQHAGMTTRSKRAMVRLKQGQSIPGFAVETKTEKNPKSEIRNPKSEPREAK